MGHKAHLIIRNLHEFDLVYLQALFYNNLPAIWEHEMAAKAEGYGPLVPCGFIAAPREQKELCRMFLLIKRETHIK